MQLDPDLADALGRRAREAWAVGSATFAVPEAADVAAQVARGAPTTALRGEAATWRDAGAGYHALVRLVAAATLAEEAAHPSAEAVYVPKVRDEVEPALALWPYVLFLPTTAEVSEATLVELRAFPVHPLGVRTDPAWADGRLCSTAEFFFHDLDHARYKVREDLLALGHAIPDAYAEGTTVDPATGRHRTIMPFAADLAAQIGPALWRGAPERRAVARRLYDATALAEHTLGLAARTLLFEIIHEKSFPLVPAVLRRELASTAHTEKLRRKLKTGFFGAAGPDPSVAGALEDARGLLLSAL